MLWPLGLLAVLLVVLTVASFGWIAEFNRQSPWELWVFAGNLDVQYERGGGQSPMRYCDDYTSRLWDFNTLYLNARREPLDLQTLAWLPRYASEGSLAGSSYYRARVTIPLWIPCTLVIALSALAWGSHLRKAKHAHEFLCWHCGYALDGLPSTCPCPECGHDCLSKSK